MRFLAIASVVVLLFIGALMNRVTAQEPQQPTENTTTAAPEVAGQLFDPYVWMFGNEGVHPFYGAKDAPVEIAFFTSYECADCARVEANLRALVRNYNDVKVFMIYLPVGQPSIAALNLRPIDYALWVWRDKPSQFTAVNNALFAHDGLHDAQSIQSIATTTTAGLPQRELTLEQKVINYNTHVATAFGFSALPGIIGGERGMQGYVSYVELERLREEILALQAQGNAETDAE